MSHRRSPSLEIPRKSLEDPGAHDLSSSDAESDHFSDAREGRNSGAESPIPTTRVEKVDDSPRHGELPGTKAYNQRSSDAVPDFVEIKGRTSRGSSISRPSSSAGVQVPLTVVEKVDPDSPSHGEIPGTQAHEIRRADAVPDLVVKASPGGSTPTSPIVPRPRSDSTPGDLPIPTTKVSKISNLPSHGEVPGTLAYKKRLGDAEPDTVEEVEGLPSPWANRFVEQDSQRDLADDGFDDDFDDFEEGAEADDFGDFDDGFKEAGKQIEASPPIAEAPASIAPVPLLDFEELDSPSEVIAAASEHLKDLFDVEEAEGNAQRLEKLPSDSSVFLTERSASLWAQLVAPPTVQPPNWLRSRIRRLFLVSLGVPVDLDEILPASKQKKLILPSARLASSSSQSPRGSSEHQRRSPSASRLKGANGSSTSLGGGRSKSKQRKNGPAPAPELDQVAVQQLVAYTPEKIGALSDDELASYVERLEEQKTQAALVLEYWLKQKDAALGDKEAFEGVIENLVKHARKIRK